MQAKGHLTSTHNSSHLEPDEQQLKTLLKYIKVIQRTASEHMICKK